ncbi:variable surface family protein [Brachyspira hyodysenteriae]|uniref:variable surface family protein n=1 Tax=Brachyspira hyodysenteriae TaxID=159 RepID=UPI00063DCA42|nr:variable surface family protein [Brachyspira hyodysenteriae]KLI16002.1 cell surface protein [Brachyspira hyodysenteriae]KLI57092.1 cell surface protein [Brachyspira hyodysenteriae]
MKRLYFILSALLITAYSAFSYTVVEDFNDFLVDENQLRIRLDRFGVLAGTENLRFMVGVSGETAGVLLDNLDRGTKGGINTFRPAAIAGFGYKTESFGIGVGYQFKYISGSWQSHTPIITATALNDNLRINVPVTIGVGSGNVNDGDIAVSTDTRIEYYTGNNIFSRIRVNLKYGMYRLKANESRSGDLTGSGNINMGAVSGTVGENGKYGFLKDTTAHSIGIDVRGYFIAATDPVLVEPQIRVLYQGSIADFTGTSYKVTTPTGTKEGGAGFGLYNIDASNPIGAFSIGDTDSIQSVPYYDFTAHNIMFTGEGASIEIGGTEYYLTKPQFLGISVPVGFTAESEFITLYLEPALSFSMITGGINSYASSAKPVRIPPLFYSVGYLVYGELYITPKPNLEWYFEAQIGSATTIDSIGDSKQGGLAFNGSTGITWKF